MLKRFPESTLASAVDGIVPARALGHAQQAAQLERAARRRARSVVEDSERQAMADLQQAREQGFAAGYSHGVRAAAEPLMALLVDAGRLRDCTAARLRTALEEALTASGADNEVVVQACRHLLQAGDEQVRLYVPRSMPELATALADALRTETADGRLSLHPCDLPRPLLHAGPVILELDLHAPLLATAGGALDAETLDTAAAERGRHYALALQQQLRDRAVPALPPDRGN